MRVAGALLWSLAVIQCVLHEAKAASLSITPSQGSLPLRALKLREALYDFYQHGGRSCKKCPPGTFVSAHCTHSGAAGTCLPCPDDTFVQHKNQYEACSNCITCRSDQVELKQCTKTSDTQCACKNGSFCSPNLPCETCRKCTARCPDGAVMVHPCTPESDIQCKETSTVSPPTSPPPGAGSIGYNVGIILGVLFILALLIFGAFKYVKRDRESSVNICNSGTIQQLKRKFHLQPSRDPDTRNAQAVLRSQGADAAGAALPLMEKRCSRLVPQHGRDPVEVLRQSFETFIRNVPFTKWKTFMRALGLTDHDIEIAEVDEKGAHDQHFHMLRTWLTKKGKEATLDTLLDTLCVIELRGVMKSVEGELISQGLYSYEGDF